jgi:uncharacterized protein YeaO (DUF488 family)
LNFINFENPINLWLVETSVLIQANFGLHLTYEVYEMPYQIKRIYDDLSANDGYRVLIDRVWPRGVSKMRAHLDAWLKELAPSTDLRKWFAHDPAKYPEFHRRYFAELDGNPEVKSIIDELKQRAKTETVTLLYSAKDEEHNQAVVLKDYLDEQ